MPLASRVLRLRVIVSHRQWHFGSARNECDRWLFPNGIVRSVFLDGLSQDERYTHSALGRGTEDRTRARVMMILSGSLSAVVEGQCTLLTPGMVIATERVADLVTHAGRGASMSIDWSSDRPVAGRTMLSASAVAALLLIHRAMRSTLTLEATTLHMQELRLVLAADGIRLDAFGESPITAGNRAEQETMTTSDVMLSNLGAGPSAIDWETQTGATARTLTRRSHALNAKYGLFGLNRNSGWRATRDFSRLLVASMILPHEDGTVGRVARAVGYRSEAALCYAFSRAGLPSPGRYRALSRAA